MREIKFRAWDKQMKNMFVPAYIVDGQVADFLDEDEKRRAVGLWSATRPTRINDCVLMQYTGFKDKNDKEKYEADICKDTSGTYVIEWQLAGFKAVFIDGRHKGQIKDLAHVAANGEIIDNIYENPELLEQEAKDE